MRIVYVHSLWLYARFYVAGYLQQQQQYIAAYIGFIRVQSKYIGTIRLSLHPLGWLFASNKNNFLHFRRITWIEKDVDSTKSKNSTSVRTESSLEN